MQKRIFKTVWGDIEHSKGWFRKLCLFALLVFVPIVGPVMIFASFFGWAREIAWDIKEPLPRKIVFNEDGKFWKRGWSIFLLLIVFELIPAILYLSGCAVPNVQAVVTIFGTALYENPMLTILKNVLITLSYILGVVCLVFAAVGSMRIAIYSTLSSGFQIKKIAKMLRRDMSGIMRIVGMVVIVGIIAVVVLVILVLLSVYPIIYIAVMNLFNSTYWLDMFPYMTQFQQLAFVLDMLFSIGPLGVIVCIVILYVMSLIQVFILLVTIRALGYWTKQFEVPLWGDQKDPLPYELYEKE